MPHLALRRPPPTRDEIAVVIRRLAPELKARGVARLSLFGSILHGEAGPDSDIDLLLDLEEGAELSLIDRLILRDMIADAIHCRVDLIPRKALIPALRASIEAEAEVIPL